MKTGVLQMSVFSCGDREWTQTLHKRMVVIPIVILGIMNLNNLCPTLVHSAFLVNRRWFYGYKVMTGLLAVKNCCEVTGYVFTLSNFGHIKLIP